MTLRTWLCCYLLLQVCTRSPGGHLRTYGHLPASVSTHLAPLIDAQQITLTAQLVPATGTDLSDLNINEQEVMTAAVAAAAAASTDPITEEPSAVLDSMQASSSSAGHNANSSASTLTRMGSGIWKVKLTATTITSAAADAGSPLDVAAALQLAADAGNNTLEPGKNSGAVLSSAFEHILQQTR